MLALIVDEPATIKAYFEKVRQLQKTGAEFPIDLDEVWPLVYARKDNAVKILKAEYIEGEDYEVFTQSGENEYFGVN